MVFSNSSYGPLKFSYGYPNRRHKMTIIIGIVMSIIISIMICIMIGIMIGIIIDIIICIIYIPYDSYIYPT